MTDPVPTPRTLDQLLVLPCNCLPLPEPHCWRCEEIIGLFDDKERELTQATSRIAVLTEALEEIREECDGRIDITNTGQPNVFMNIDGMARAALAGEKP